MNKINFVKFKYSENFTSLDYLTRKGTHQSVNNIALQTTSVLPLTFRFSREAGKENVEISDLCILDYLNIFLLPYNWSRKVVSFRVPTSWKQVKLLSIPFWRQSTMADRAVWASGSPAQSVQQIWGAVRLLGLYGETCQQIWFNIWVRLHTFVLSGHSIPL